MAISQDAWNAFLNNINGGGSGMGTGGSGGGGTGGYGGRYNYSPGSFEGMTEEEFIAYLNSLPAEEPYYNIYGDDPNRYMDYGTPDNPDYYRDHGGHGGTGAPIPSGGANRTLYDQLENPGRPGYYHTGGGTGYIHGTPEDEQRAWQLFLDMKRNGWDPYAPGSIEEARRGMGEFTDEQFNEYFRNFLDDQKAQDPAGGEGTPKLGKWNDWLVSLLGKGKLGKLGLGKWLKNAQEGATFDDWLTSLQPNQLDYIDEWMTGLGADKNWEDRLRQGDSPFSRGAEAIDHTARQNPNGPDLVNREDDPPSPGGGPRGPRDGGGDGGGEPEPSYDGPLGLPAYAGMAFKPEFLAYQPYNTNGPIQFVPGKG